MVFSLLQFSRSVMSDSLRPHGPQHTRPPYSSPTPQVYSNSFFVCLIVCLYIKYLKKNHMLPILNPPPSQSNSCPLSQWCHLTNSSPAAFSSSCFRSFPASKYWSFSISLSSEYSGLVFLRMDWFELLAVTTVSALSIDSPTWDLHYSALYICINS